MSGPSPTCEQRNMADASEWGLLKTTAVVWQGWNPQAHKVPPKIYWNNRAIQVKNKDILVTKAGPRNRVGVVVYVSDTPSNLMVSGKMIGLRPKSELVDYRVLAAVLSADKTQRYLDSRTTGMAESQLNFTNELLLNTEVYLPPIEVQKRLGKLISLIDKQANSTKALIKKYQQVKSGIMFDFFTRGIGSDGQLRPPREQAPELYHDTKVGWIPKEWDVHYLNDLTTKVVDGVHHTPNYVEHGIPFVTVKNLTASSEISFEKLNYIDTKTHLKCYSRADPKPGDVLVTKDGTLGVCRIVKDGMPDFSIFVSVALLRVTQELTAEWLKFFFDSGEYLKQLGSLSAGTGLKHIHLEHFKKFLIALPPLREQEELNRRLKVIENKIISETQFYNKQIKQKSGLINDLLTNKNPLPIGGKEAQHV
jgi:type I restriction enzyme S subunit